MTPRLFCRDVTKQCFIGCRRPFLNKRPFDLQPMKSNSGVALWLNFLNRMRHCRNHWAGQPHAIELYHCPLLEKGFHFKHLGRIRWCFEHSNWQHALVVRLREGRRIDFDWFTTLARKNAIVHGCRVSPRRIKHQCWIMPRFLFPLPLNVISLAEYGSRFQANLIVTTDWCFELFKTVIKGRVRSAKNGGRRLFF